MNDSHRGTWHQAYASWFFTNLLGTLVVIGFFTVGAVSDTNARDPVSGILMLSGMVGILAAVGSLVMVPIGYVVFNVVLSVERRWLRVALAFLAVGGFFGGVLLLMSLLSKNMGRNGWIPAVPYFLGSLAATAKVYGKGLMRPKPFYDEEHEDAAQ